MEKYVSIYMYIGLVCTRLIVHTHNTEGSTHPAHQDPVILYAVKLLIFVFTKTAGCKFAVSFAKYNQEKLSNMSI